jgi:hypothetical protein
MCIRDRDGDAHTDAVGTADELTELELAVGHGRTDSERIACHR